MVKKLNKECLLSNHKIYKRKELGKQEIRDAVQ